MENLNITQITNTTTKPIVCIQTFKSCEDSVLSLERTLREMNPGFVILYHSNVTAIRQIEVYEAQQKRHPRDRLKVFFVVHSQTVEEQSYLTSLRREKEAFDLLIKTKQVKGVASGCRALSICGRLCWLLDCYRQWLCPNIKTVKVTTHFYG